jgi:hypothetical protein
MSHIPGQHRLFSTFLVVLLLVSGSHARGQPPGDDAVREVLAARLQSLQSIEVTYEVVHTFSPRDVVPGFADAPARVGFSVRVGVDRSTDRFSFLHGRARWEFRKSQETVDAEAKRYIAPVVETILTYSNGTTEQLTVRTDEALGAIESRAAPPKYRVWSSRWGCGMAMGAG